jgi:hypothetical protein
MESTMMTAMIVLIQNIAFQPRVTFSGVVRFGSFSIFPLFISLVMFLPILSAAGVKKIKGNL